MKMWKVNDDDNDNNHNDNDDDGQRTNFDQMSSLKPSAHVLILYIAKEFNDLPERSSYHRTIWWHLMEKCG